MMSILNMLNCLQYLTGIFLDLAREREREREREIATTYVPQRMVQ